jgi:hypothetical protein
VANAVTMTTVPEIEPFNLTAPQINFEVSNVNGKVTVTTNSPQIVSQVLTFNKFNTGLGTLTGVTITFTTAYGATATVSVVGSGNGDSETIDFFADATIGHSLTGGLIVTQSSPQSFSASCQADPGDTCASGPQPNNNTFNNLAGVGLAAPVTSFNGPGTYDLTATLTSALAPRITPDNGTSFADNTTFDGTLNNTSWNGSVSVVYTYETGARVPEPLSLYLLIAGLGGIALSRRRRP